MKSIQALPNNFETEQAIEQIVLLEKIRVGLEQSEQGLVHSKSHAKKSLKKWLK
ncbi:MAG: hypothetical protein JST58_03655 [Bacteroidetes bacterium]|nr:hypothetical protein [Bacteroidota bacterium]